MDVAQPKWILYDPYKISNSSSTWSLHGNEMLPESNGVYANKVSNMQMNDTIFICATQMIYVHNFMSKLHTVEGIEVVIIITRGVTLPNYLVLIST
jgi:hypothetical protein